jgi:sugar phosphate isomerase/epimerase
MINRRQFLQASTHAGLGALALHGRATAAATRLAKIGLQLYTVRNEMARDVEGTLKRVAELGYREVEFAGYYNRTAKDVRAMLDRYGLASPAAHVPLKDVQAGLGPTLEFAQALGQKFLICPYLEAKDRGSLDDYKRHAATFNQAGEACRKAGIQFGYHNHDFEFQPFGGRMPYDQLLAETDPKLVTMELDLYWIAKANQDALAYLAKHPGRFTIFHVKEMDKTDKRGITEVGRGVIDFKTIFAKSKGAIRHYFVEQDTCPGSPFDSIQVSMDYLKQLEF